MENRYARNRIYINTEEQEVVKDFPVLLAGSGIGSVIAECALRFGFETLTIIDGDNVELSNLNRQNYVEQDIHQNKTESISNRLLAINKDANIKCINTYLDENNIEEHITGHKAAINALDFSTPAPLLFDTVCQNLNIPVLHPYNVGWGSLVTIMDTNSLLLDAITKPDDTLSEVNMVKYASSYLKFWGNPQPWIDNTIEEYINEKESLSPPQLSIASWSVAAMCTHLLYNIATEKKYKRFPEFYMSNVIDDNF